MRERGKVCGGISLMWLASKFSRNNLLNVDKRRFLLGSCVMSLSPRKSVESVTLRSATRCSEAVDSSKRLDIWLLRTEENGKVIQESVRKEDFLSLFGGNLHSSRSTGVKLLQCLEWNKKGTKKKTPKFIFIFFLPMQIEPIQRGQSWYGSPWNVGEWVIA